MKKFFNDHAAKIAVVAILVLIAVFAILIYKKVKNGSALTVAGQAAAEAEQAEAEKNTDETTEK